VRWSSSLGVSPALNTSTRPLHHDILALVQVGRRCWLVIVDCGKTDGVWRCLVRGDVVVQLSSITRSCKAGALGPGSAPRAQEGHSGVASANLAGMWIGKADLGESTCRGRYRGDRSSLTGRGGLVPRVLALGKRAEESLAAPAAILAGQSRPRRRRRRCWGTLDWSRRKSLTSLDWGLSVGLARAMTRLWVEGGMSAGKHLAVIKVQDLR